MATHSCIRSRDFIRVLGVVCFLIGLSASNGHSTTWYVAPNGADANAGSSNSPFATIIRAQTAARAGDVVYLRGGTYLLNNGNLTATNNPWAVVNNLTKSGVSYVAFPGERPVLDFTGVQPLGYRVTAFLVTASDCAFVGFDVIGVQVTMAGTHTQSECFRVAGGNRNRFERLAMHDGMGIGWYLTSGQSNLVLNCDAYDNRGLDSGSLGNIDGFGAHPNSTSGTGNVFRGCRAWFNSDDGFDCINAKAKVTFDHCWSFYNGYFTNFASSGGDGNGFKSGGYGVSGGSVPNPVPRHVTEFCLAVRNRANGFYANHHTGGLDWLNNTACWNSANFNLLCNLDAQSSSNDVPGFDQWMRNNLGYAARSTEVANLGPSNDMAFNYFTLPVVVTSNDFLALNESLLTLPRPAGGELPYIAFGQLVGSSDGVDAGANAGFPFAGFAPDLGAFEHGIHSPPTLALRSDGQNLMFSGAGGPAGGTFYLSSGSNLALPAFQWARVTTNSFDLAGLLSMTNPIPADVQQFYRLALP